MSEKRVELFFPPAKIIFKQAEKKATTQTSILSAIAIKEAKIVQQKIDCCQKSVDFSHAAADADHVLLLRHLAQPEDEAADEEGAVARADWQDFSTLIRGGVGKSPKRSLPPKSSLFIS